MQNRAICIGKHFARNADSILIYIFGVTNSNTAFVNPERYAVPLTNALVKGDIPVAEVVNLSVFLNNRLTVDDWNNTFSYIPVACNYDIP